MQIYKHQSLKIVRTFVVARNGHVDAPQFRLKFNYAIIYKVLPCPTGNRFLRPQLIPKWRFQISPLKLLLESKTFCINKTKVPPFLHSMPEIFQTLWEVISSGISKIIDKVWYTAFQNKLLLYGIPPSFSSVLRQIQKSPSYALEDNGL